VNDESAFRVVLIVGWLILVPVLVYHRIRSQATGERLDRRQEGWFVLLTLVIRTTREEERLLARFGEAY
jgi:protein-S-isoprenylcysteine O-methyltransferase Ste14